MCLFSSFGCYGTGINHKVCTMQVSWGGRITSFFSVSNGVRQGGVLSPFLFAGYIDDLSRLLNNVRAGCYVGNSCINHIFLQMTFV